MGKPLFDLAVIVKISGGQKRGLQSGPSLQTVVIDGRILKRAGKLTALPEAQVVTDARAALEGIRKRANWR